MRSLLILSLLLVVITGCSSRPQPFPINPDKLVDLSYTFGKDTIYWPTAEPFKLQRVAYGMTTAGYWYAANNISMAEHGGTHMDAPIHFAEGKRTSSEVPLASCIGPALVIDITEACERNADYQLTADDIRAWERQHGHVFVGSIVVIRTGWGLRWPNKETYLGTAKPLDVANLHFPGISADAAELLVTRKVAAVAIDTASIDPGQSKDFKAHQILNVANKPAFENVANVDKLPVKGATFIALPLKIEAGSGGPARIIAVLP